MKAKVTRKAIGRREATKDGKGKTLVVHRAGAVIEVSDGELKRFGDRLEVIQEDKPKSRGRPKKAEPEPMPEVTPEPEADGDI